MKKIKIGDHVVVWREKYLSENNLLGKIVKVLEIKYHEGYVSITSSGRFSTQAPVYIIVFDEETEEVYELNINAISLAKKPEQELSKWDSDIFMPEVLR